MPYDPATGSAIWNSSGGQINFGNPQPSLQGYNSGPNSAASGGSGGDGGGSTFADIIEEVTPLASSVLGTVDSLFGKNPPYSLYGTNLNGTYPVQSSGSKFLTYAIIGIIVIVVGVVLLKFLKK